MNAREIAEKFRPASELHAEAPDPPEPVFGRYLRRGDLGLTSGAPKAGKTTFTTALIEALVSGAGTFLGEPIAHGPVVLVSEERTASLVERLQHPDVHVVTRDMLAPKPSWPDLVQGAVLKAQQLDAVLLVIDTVRWWSDLAGKQSHDDGAVMATMRELAPASAAGITVLAVVHHRKGGGEAGEAVAGSNAFVGAVDVLLEWERPGGDASRTVRQLVATGRWPDTPGVLLADYDPVTRCYRVLGHAEDRGEAKRLPWRERLLAVLPADRGVPHEGLTYDELEALLHAKKPKWAGELSGLFEEGKVRRDGKGVKGDPLTFLKIPSPDSVPQEDGITRLEAPAYSVLPFREDGIQEPESNRSSGSVLSAEDGIVITADELVDALLDDPILGAVEVDPVAVDDAPTVWTFGGVR